MCAGGSSPRARFDAFVNERQDGYDTLEWLVAQPWCNGDVGMFGGSYVGLTQWQAAISGHPALKVIAPAITAADYHAGWAYQGGAFELGFNLSWTMGALALNTVLRKRKEDPAAEATFQTLLTSTDNLPKEFTRLPLAGHDILGEFAPYYDNWANHPTYDDFWANLDVSTRYEHAECRRAQYRRLVRHLPQGDDRQLHRYARDRPGGVARPAAPPDRPVESRRPLARQPDWRL